MDNLTTANSGILHQTTRNHRVLSWLGLLIGVFLAIGCTRQGEFPDRPITIICPWSAGGGTDRVARQMAVQLEGELGVPVNVINATGGGGVTGHTRGSQARGDGYTLSMITVELSMLHWRGLTNLTHRDFAPLQLLNRDAAALFVRHDSPYRSLDDLNAAVVSSPNKLKATGTAFGGIWHIAVAGWLDSRGLAADGVTWISINGAGPSVQELLAGGVDFICCSLPEADAVLSGGQVRCLGVMSEQRIAGFDSVPTFQEQGHLWSIAGWRGLAAPRDTPQARLDLLSTAIQNVTRSDSFTSFMAASGFDVSLENASQFSQTLERQDQLFGNILTSEAFASVSGEHFGPMMFPRFIAIGLLIALISVMIEIRAETHHTQSLSGKGSDPLRIGSQTTGDDLGDVQSLNPAGNPDQGESLSVMRALGVALAIVFYGLTSEPLGFITAAICMLAGLLLVLRVPRWTAITVAVITAVLTYQIFGVLLRVPLPHRFLEW